MRIHIGVLIGLPFLSLSCAGLMPSSSHAAGKPSASQDCFTEHFKFVPLGITPVEMHVKQGASCAFHFEATSGDQGTFGILSSRMIRRPSNGIAGHASIRRYGYKPKPEFSGDDEMDIAVTYDHDGNTRSTTLNIKIHVEP